MDYRVMKRFYILLFTLCVTFATKAQRAEVQLSNQESFSMIVFGDAQSYTRFDQNQPILELCTAWMAGNAEKLNLQAVLFTGDVVQTNDNLVVKGKKKATSIYSLTKDVGASSFANFKL